LTKYGEQEFDALLAGDTGGVRSLSGVFQKTSESSSDYVSNSGADKTDLLEEDLMMKPSNS